MENNLIKRFEEEFEVMKKDLGFKPSLDDIDNIFFLRDFILKERFVSRHLSRWMCTRIVETYMIWINYLHSLIAPNPAYLVSINESQAFTDKEREAIGRLISRIMVLIGKNTLTGITKDKISETEFIDHSVRFWNETFKPEIIHILEKVNKKWVKDVSKKEP